MPPLVAIHFVSRLVGVYIDSLLPLFKLQHLIPNVPWRVPTSLQSVLSTSCLFYFKVNFNSNNFGSTKLVPSISRILEQTGQLFISASVNGFSRHPSYHYLTCLLAVPALYQEEIHGVHCIGDCN